VGVPTREARLAHARVHCLLWNEGRKDEWVASWRTIVPGAVRMLDPVGTKEKHGIEHATTCRFQSCVAEAGTPRCGVAEFRSKWRTSSSGFRGGSDNNTVVQDLGYGTVRC
jgi:hypothetical protein